MNLPTPSVPVSWGELLDKLTILAIKRERIGDPARRANVEREFAALREVGTTALERGEVADLYAALARINEALWDIEDGIRAEEAAGRFGAAFVALARSVYLRNDERAAVKRRINDALGSELVEEKSYAAIR